MSYITNLPVNGTFDVPAYFGQTGLLWKNGHKGIDIWKGSKDLYSICDGKVTVVGWDENGWGRYVSIQPEGFPRIRCILCHFEKDSVKVKKGQKVTRTTVLGTMGTTGNSTGVHVHIEIRVTDKNGKNAKSVNPAEYMGIKNEKATGLNSADYKTTQEKSNAIFQKMINDYDGVKAQPAKPVVKDLYKVKIVKINNLNVRSGPSALYKKTGTVALGKTYTVVEVKNKWGKLKEVNGWVNLAYTQKI